MSLSELKKIISEKYIHRGKTKPCWCKKFNIGGSWDTPSMSRRCMCEHLKSEHHGHCKGIITEQYTLSSGAKSTKYFDIKSMILDVNDDDATILFDAVIEKLDGIHIGFKSIGGIELGGALLAAQIAYDYIGPETVCVIRKQPRVHGLKKQIEGNPVSPILLVDDVLSSGSSVKDAIRTCHEEGFEVAGLLCVIDRTYVEDYAGKRYYDAPPGLWFHDIKPIGNEKNHLDGLDLPVYALFKERENDPLGSYNPNSVHLFKE